MVELSWWAIELTGLVFAYPVINTLFSTLFLIASRRPFVLLFLFCFVLFARPQNIMWNVTKDRFGKNDKFNKDILFLKLVDAADRCLQTIARPCWFSDLFLLSWCHIKYHTFQPILFITSSHLLVYLNTCIWCAIKTPNWHHNSHQSSPHYIIMMIIIIIIIIPVCKRVYSVDNLSLNHETYDAEWEYTY